MFDKIIKTLQDASESIMDQASNLGEGAKEKTNKLIDDWMLVFPRLEAYGLEITSLSLGVALSPSLEVEMKGKHENFTQERLQQILDSNKNNAAITSVFSTVKTAYNLHRKIYASQREPLIVKVRIKLSPEIKVFIGEPIIQ